MERKIDYNTLIDRAMRGLVKEILVEVEQAGTLPGNHHFYISFYTDEEGVVLSPVLKKDYPREMTIVLQHQFEDLKVSPSHFTVTLWFHGSPEHLVIPFQAITAFADPIIPFSVQFGKKSQVLSPEPGANKAEPNQAPSLPAPNQSPSATKADSDAGVKVISLRQHRERRKPEPSQPENFPNE